MILNTSNPLYNPNPTLLSDLKTLRIVVLSNFFLGKKPDIHFPFARKLSGKSLLFFFNKNW